MKDYNSPEEILQDICELFNTSLDKVITECRKKELVMIRHYYCYIAHVYYKRFFSLTAIAEVLNRDHTTVIHGRNKVIDFLSDRIKEEVTISDINKIKKLLQLDTANALGYNDLANENAELQRKIKRLKVQNTKLNHDNICQRIKIQRLERKINSETSVMIG